ncbi:hypothetical protein LZ554_008190 [Drepanopeziza brunnea f. sp. 'monogermtubi']|nr:hypothetical protein LZ554_008190 [Drepanopeziza brunnea f. sp. 'monogermtubi']
MADPARPNSNMTPAMLEEINFWRNYRGEEGDLDMAVAQDYYRLHPYAFPDTPQPEVIPPRITFNGAPGVLAPVDKIPPEQYMKDFLAQDVPGIPRGGGNWKAIRLLGEGVSALVGLWEWTGLAGGRQPNFDKVAVKELKADAPATNTTIDIEDRWLTHFRDTTNSIHLVRMLADAQALVLGSDEGLDAAFDGRLRRLFLEYCENGDLSDLLEKRIVEQKPFSELSLWLIFECMVDAICVLANGSEMSENRRGDWVSDKIEGWSPIVHFDLKPENIFVGRRNRQHMSVPVYKFGDFGVAAIVEHEEVEKDDIERRIGLRRRGTPGYITPEQFTAQWDSSDWYEVRPAIAGRFGPWTMLWSVGAMMYQLLTLDGSPPDHLEPFLPDFDIDGDDQPPTTYGLRMMAYDEYSVALRDLIFQCLFETPDERPTLENIRLRVANGIEDTLSLNQAVEPYEDFTKAEPGDAPVVVPPVAPAIPAVVAPVVVPPPVVAPVPAVVAPAPAIPAVVAPVPAILPVPAPPVPAPPVPAPPVPAPPVPAPPVPAPPVVPPAPIIAPLPLPAAAAPLPQTSIFRCQGLLATGVQCSNTMRLPLPQPVPPATIVMCRQTHVYNAAQVAKAQLLARSKKRRR